MELQPFRTCGCSLSSLRFSFRTTRPFLRRTAEPGWHRAQRKRRTRSRFVLAAFLSGVPTGAHRVLAAAQCLNRHHSRSGLGRLAIKKLQSQPILQPAAGAMSSAARHAWCGQCYANRSARAAYCPTCGSSLQMYTVPAQHNSQEWRQSSPRRRTSPRRRQTAAETDGRRSGAQRARSGKRQAAQATEDGQEQRQGQGASCHGHAPACGSSSDLTAEAGDGQCHGTDTSEEGELLGALLAHIGDSGSLPSSLAERVQSFQATNAKSTGKLLHKQVARQTEARTQLQKLARDRQSFLEGWADCLQVLTTTVEQQVEKMSKVLGDFDTAETTCCPRRAVDRPRRREAPKPWRPKMRRLPRQRRRNRAPVCRRTRFARANKNSEQSQSGCPDPARWLAHTKAQATRHRHCRPRTAAPSVAPSSCTVRDFDGAARLQVMNLLLGHSVVGEPDYVSDWVATLLAASWRLDLGWDAYGVAPSLLDPRLGPLKNAGCLSEALSPGSGINHGKVGAGSSGGAGSWVVAMIFQGLTVQS